MRLIRQAGFFESLFGARDEVTIIPDNDIERVDGLNCSYSCSNPGPPVTVTTKPGYTFNGCADAGDNPHGTINDLPEEEE